jgi:hypothetical protein
MRIQDLGPSEHVRFVPLAEDVVEGKRLGRHVVHDQRSRAFEAQLAEKIVSAVHQAAGLPLNQAKVGSCTAEAETGAGNAQPNLPAGAAPRTQADAYALYHEETVLENEPWPPNDPGGSGLMVCKAAKKMGLLKSYRHAFGIDQALRATVLRPTLWGVPWYDSFDSPNAEGIVSLPKGAKIRGGHEICALRVIAEHELVGFAQSWGPGYGVPDPAMGLSKGGAFYIPFAVLSELLAQQGDVTVPIFH